MSLNNKPKKSLRTLLMLWFLMFSVVPLAFITGYSVVKYEQAIDQEQTQRLEGNRREVETILKDFEAELVDKTTKHASDNSLIYHLSQNNISSARSLVKKWLLQSWTHRISIFNREGRLEVLLYKDQNGEVRREQAREGTDVYLSEEFLKNVDSLDIRNQIEIRKGRSLDLISFAKVKTANGRLVGYIEEIIELDKSFLEGLKKRLNTEFVFFTEAAGGGKENIVASHDDLEVYKTKYFLNELKNGDFFELNIREASYGFMIRPIQWGDQKFYMALGASKDNVKNVLKNVNYAFFTVVGTIIFLLVFLSMIISKILLKPLSDLLTAIEETRPGEEIREVPTASETELGQLIKSFNDMSQKVNKAQNDLKKNINELEGANQEIRDTQARLVHSAKMASLGQLVAGVAHELNNPIGFIYSNMGHLRDYSKSLVGLVNTAEKSPDKLKKEKEKVEFDYIVEDMPKLIKSCEDGAKRTRDIVLGLRNFSRLEEAKIKEVNIEESLENTLSLLSGELKNRIEVKKEFSGVPDINCYPSQLNQVFMNIISNAAQAIDENGEILIKTSVNEEMVDVSIRDTGKGMDAETAQKIFDPFFTTKTLGKGTGLGLSISYGIIEKHGGDIKVNSEVGVGTEFIISLPIKGPAQG